MSYNSHLVKDFYDEVIEDFGSRLYNKFNNKEQGFDHERIDHIKKKIQEKMQNQKLLFKNALEIKHSSVTSLHRDGQGQGNDQNQGLIKNEVKEEGHQDEEEGYIHLLPEGGDNNEIILDDNPVKKEESPEPVKHEINDDDREDEEERERKEMSDNLKSNLSLHIVGTYEAKSKKHIAKDEATRLELENVFIKYKDRNEQIFCQRLVCELKKE